MKHTGPHKLPSGSSFRAEKYDNVLFARWVCANAKECVALTCTVKGTAKETCTVHRFGSIVMDSGNYGKKTSTVYEKTCHKSAPTSDVYYADHAWTSKFSKAFDALVTDSAWASGYIKWSDGVTRSSLSPRAKYKGKAL